MNSTKQPTRRYRVVATNDKTGKRTVTCPGPFTHAEAVTVLSKFAGTYQVCRIHLEEI